MKHKHNGHAQIRRCVALARILVPETCAARAKTKASTFDELQKAGQNPDLRRLPGPHNDPQYEGGELLERAELYWEATSDLRTSYQGHLLQHQNALLYAQNATTNFASPMQSFTTSPEAFLSVKIADPKDAKRILRDHVQKPIFYQVGFLGHGLLGQEDNSAWQKQVLVLMLWCFRSHI